MSSVGNHHYYFSVKILPSNFNNVIRPDPSVIHESPEPIVYRCRKCRRILASKSHTLPHTPPRQRFENRQNSEQLTEEESSSPCQPVIFVEPIAWMKNIGHEAQGRLYCPKCNQKLGNFSWVNGMCWCVCVCVQYPSRFSSPSNSRLPLSLR